MASGNADEIGTERRHAVIHLIENASPERESRWPEVVEWQATHTRQPESAGRGLGWRALALGKLSARRLERKENRRVLRIRMIAPV